MLRNIPISVRLLVVGTLIMVIPLVAVALLSANRTVSGLTVVESEQLSARAADIALMIDNVFREEKKVAASLALDPTLEAAAAAVSRDPSRAEAKVTAAKVAAATARLKELANATGVGDGYEAFVAVGPDGMPFAASDPRFLGVSLADQPYFKNAINGAVDAGSAGLNKVTNQPSVPVSAPIHSNDHIFGAFVAVADITFLTNLIANEKVGTSGYAFIVDGNGTMIAHPEKSYLFSMKITGQKGMEDLARRMLGGQNGVSTYTFRDTPSTAGYALVKSTGWSVCLTLPNEEFLAVATESRTLILLIGAAALLIAFVVYLFFARTITKPLARAVEFTELLAKGDFSHTLDIHQRDEVGRLATALNDMAGQFVTIVSGIQDGAGQVSSASAEINVSAQKLAEGAQNQASTLEETSASMEQLTASVDQVAEHARGQVAVVEGGTASMKLVDGSIAEVSRDLATISDLANRSVENSQEGAAAVSQVAEGIRLIAGSSEKIDGIVTVIREIADQTNLLALNAAIEAARAGEHGRGFAVVADEVGKLAERSASSTKEITALIKESAKNVELGVRTAQRSQIAMEQIRAASQQVQEMIAGLNDSMGRQVDAVKELAKALEKVSDMSQSISAATEEQTASSRQVSKAVENVNEVTQAAAASAEEMSASTEELTELSRRLSNLVARFVITGDSDADGTATIANPEEPAPAQLSAEAEAPAADEAVTEEPAEEEHTEV